MRRLLTLGIGAGLAGALGVGLVLAQDIAPPPPPGYTPGVGYANPPPGAPAASAPAAVALSEGPPPEEGGPPPPQASGNEVAPAEPEPSPNLKKGEPMKRPRYGSAILQAVDKVTAETLRFEARVGEPVRYKGLVLTVRACEETASDEGFSDAFAHLDVQAQPDPRQPTRSVFRGWMFASSPGLHAVEHPLYDVWLIACKAPAPRPAVASL